MKALDAIFEVMNVSRSHLEPNKLLREVFDDDFKSLKPEALRTLERLLPLRAPPEGVVISTCFYSGFMRWLSKFLGALHLELNTEDLERCKLNKSEISKITQLGGSSLGGSSSSSLGLGLSSSDHSEALDKLEQIDPDYEDDGDGLILEAGGNDDDDGEKTDEDEIDLIA